MNRKKIITIAVAFLIGMIVGAPIVNYVYASFTKTIEVATGISIEVNGEKFIPKDANGKEVEVFIYNGTTYLPIRAISGMYGSDIKWDGERETVRLFKKDASSSDVMGEIIKLDKVKNITVSTQMTVPKKDITLKKEKWEELLDKLSSFSFTKIDEESKNGWQYLIKIEEEDGKIILISFMNDRAIIGETVYKVEAYDANAFLYLFK